MPEQSQHHAPGIVAFTTRQERGEVDGNARERTWWTMSHIVVLLGKLSCRLLAWLFFRRRCN
jgi:hypothetical protein